MANVLNLYDLKKKLTPGVILTLPRVIYIYITIIVKQVYWYMYISQVSGERLQDHGSYGFIFFLIQFHVPFKVISAHMRRTNQ